MRFILCFIIILINFLFLANSQTTTNQWQKVDSLAINTPLRLSQNIDSLAHYIHAFNFSEKEKARFIYRWITNNISYDVDGFRLLEIGKSKQRIKKVLQSKKAVCQGYSNLFEALATKLNLKSWTILGYGKTHVGGNMDYHAWNGVQIDSKWYLLDATWASGYIQDGNFIKFLNDNFFLSPPSEFVKNHLPLDPIWQLSEYPISKSNFDMDTKSLKINSLNFKDSLNIYFSLDSINREKVFYQRCMQFDKECEICKNGFVNILLQMGNKNLAIANDTLNAYFNILKNNTNIIKYWNNNETKIRTMIIFAFEKYDLAIKIYQEGFGIDELNQSTIEQNIKSATDNKLRAEKEQKFIDVLYKTKKPLRIFTFTKYNEITR